MRTLDHFNGRRLKGIKVSKDGTWRIMLEGNAQICNHDSGLQQPDIPKKMWGELHFAVSILEEERTTLVFKTEDYSQEWRVILNPTMYSIKVDKEEEEFPQRGMALTPSIPDHPDERVAEGPVEEGEEE